MKKLLLILGIATLTVTPVTTILSTSNNYSLLDEKTELLIENNTLKQEQLSTGDVVEYINLYLKTWAVGKAWGTGKPNNKTLEGKVEIDLTEYGGQFLFQDKFESVEIKIDGEYDFRRGKEFNWEGYHNEKEEYIAPRVITWYTKEVLDEWVLVKDVNNQDSHSSKNYYRSEVKVSFKDQNKLVIELRYTISAYGVGNNWYWTAGTVRAPKATLRAR